MQQKADDLKIQRGRIDVEIDLQAFFIAALFNCEIKAPL